MDIVGERRRWNHAVAKARGVVAAAEGLDAIMVRMTEPMVERLGDSSPSHEMWSDDDEEEWRERAADLLGAKLPLTDVMLWTAICCDVTTARNLAGYVESILASTAEIQNCKWAVEVTLGLPPNLQGLLDDEVAAIVGLHQRKRNSLEKGISEIHRPASAALSATTWVGERRKREVLLTKDVLENRLISASAERIIGIFERIQAASGPEPEAALAAKQDAPAPT